ncbi:MAG TPA: hypothetical protein VMU17_07480 [Elusimicrobiota bacterium]|nr:hypothetical protein [Elusimicrobiota bacterium]
MFALFQQLLSRRVQGLFVFGVLCASGCASSPAQSDVARSLQGIAGDLQRKGENEAAARILENAHRLDPSIAPASVSLSTPTAAAALQRVRLPYSFHRHGVEVRVIAVEAPSSGRLLLDARLSEERGESIELALPRLLEVRQADAPLTFQSAAQGSIRLPSGSIFLRPNDVMDVSLAYDVNDGSAAVAGPIEVRFPTGRWWRSE